MDQTKKKKRKFLEILGKSFPTKNLPVLMGFLLGKKKFPPPFKVGLKEKIWKRFPSII